MSTSHVPVWFKPSGACLLSNTNSSVSSLVSRRGLRSSGPALESVTIEVPQMGDSISEGTIATVDKAAGDAVGEDEVIVQVETDKVTIDIRSPGAGVVEEILVAEDDTVVVGQPVAKVNLGAAGSADSSSPPPAEEVKDEEPKVEEVKVEAAAPPPPKAAAAAPAAAAAAAAAPAP